MARVTFHEADLKVMQGNIARRRSVVPVVVKTVVKNVKIEKPSPGKDFIEMMLKNAKIDYRKEYVFHEGRKFRFDFCFWGNGKSVAIEYEGIYSGTSRHTTMKGYTNDCTKYNLAALDGWIVLRYTGSQYKKFADDLKRVLS